MKAIVYDRYGPPEVLRLDEVPRPEPRDGEVLVEVHTAGVNAGDRHLVRGDPFLVRMVFGLTRPKRGRIGSDVAGRVVEVGRDVRDLRPGDEVFGELSNHGFGAFAEFVCAPESAFVPKPGRLSFEDAAAAPTSGLAALQSLEKGGGIGPGRTVLINGASGGVGTFAVQIAKGLGAEVTAVCSADSAPLVRSLGADHVIDYRSQDFTRGGRRWDLVVDLAARHPLWRTRRAVEDRGAYVMVGGSTPVTLQSLVLGPLMSLAGRKKASFFLMSPKQEDLLRLRDLLEAATVRPVIDRRFRLHEVPDAIRHLEDGHPRGKVVVEVKQKPT